MPTALPLATALNPNAGWCWFQCERALTHGGKLFVGSVASGPIGTPRAGNIEVTQHDLTTGETTVAVLAERLEEEDHNAPALHVRADGRLVACYSKHSTDRLARWRMSVRPGDATTWQPKPTTCGPSPRPAGAAGGRCSGSAARSPRTRTTTWRR